MCDLTAELATAHRKLTGRHVEFLARHGIPKRSLFDFAGDRLAGHFGIDAVRLLDAGLYLPDHEGDPALIIAVREGYDLVDLMALRSDRPGKWWRRTGAATFLGPDAVERAEYFGQPLTMWASPWHWLRAECTGSVTLGHKTPPSQYPPEARHVA